MLTTCDRKNTQVEQISELIQLQELRFKMSAQVQDLFNPEIYSGSLISDFMLAQSRLNLVV
jgi:hypothetical protein